MSHPSKPNLFSRGNWVQETQFHPHDCRGVLDAILEKIRLKKPAERAFLVLDLDSTLYEVGPRTHKIILEWLTHHPQLPQQIHHALQKLQTGSVGYSIADNFRLVGLNPDETELQPLVERLKEFWWERFFTSAYLPHDRPYPGTVDFVNYAFSLGAEICYLTGREEKTMRPGTEANLRRDKFPWDSPRTCLLMRRPPHTTDVAHKSAAAEWIQTQGTVIASFENEPANLVRLQQLIPQAMHVFCETVCSELPAEKSSGLYRIKSFRDFTRR